METFILKHMSVSQHYKLRHLKQKVEKKAVFFQTYKPWLQIQQIWNQFRQCSHLQQWIWPEDRQTSAWYQQCQWWKYGEC